MEVSRLQVTVILTIVSCLCAKLQAASLVFTPEDEVSVSSMTQDRSKPGTQYTPDTHLYLFAADGKKQPYSYVNDVGELVGFDVDIVTRVCSLVGKQCKMIMLPFTECIFTYKDIDYAGRGLWGQWVDGCPSYAITTDRRTEFDFTLPYLATTASFTVAPGNPTGFDPNSDDYSAFTLVRLTGAPTNGPCLNRLRKSYGKFITAENLPEAKALLLNGTADVLFSPRTHIDGLDTLQERVHCDEGGAGVLLRKGSDLATWWNPAFQTFYFSGQYAQMCEQATQKYGANVQCLPTPELASPELLAMMKADPPTPSPDHLWKFVVSGKIEPYSYLDGEGNLIGWTKDFIDEVCSRANKQCHLMLAKVSECTTRDEELLYPGRGLMEGWFDACTGYFETMDRDNSWDFTAPYLISNASFYVKPGNPSNFDPTMDDYSKFVIVHADTAITNDHCLNRLQKKFDKLLDVPTRVEAIEAVLNGTADAWFTKRKGETQLEELAPRFHCENVGTSIMTKKGSLLPQWWNAAFQEFYSTGDFNQFCRDKGLQYNFNCPNPASHCLQETFNRVFEHLGCLGCQSGCQPGYVMTANPKYHVTEGDVLGFYDYQNVTIPKTRNVSEPEWLCLPGDTCPWGFFTSKIDVTDACSYCGEGCRSCQSYDNCDHCVMGYKLTKTKLPNGLEASLCISSGVECPNSPANCQHKTYVSQIVGCQGCMFCEDGYLPTYNPSYRRPPENQTGMYTHQGIRITGSLEVSEPRYTCYQGTKCPVGWTNVTRGDFVTCEGPL